MTHTLAKFKSPENYNDRELSWLAFNDRVLEEAEDQTTPLLERLRFLGIASSNLDEFFMVRVSGVQEQVKAGVRTPNLAGHLPEVHFRLLHERIHQQVARQYRCLKESVIPALEKEQVYLRDVASLTRGQREFVRRFFDREVFPVLTPLAVDSGHPFPHLRNLSLNLAVRLVPPRKEKNSELFALVQVPQVLDRLVKLPPQRPGNHEFLLLEELISSEIQLLFPGLRTREVCAFRVTRDADIEYAEEEADDLLKTVEDELRQRERGDAVRLGIERKASPELLQQLRSTLKLEGMQVYLFDGPINLSEVAQIANHVDRPELKYPPFVPNQREPLGSERSVFRAAAREDLLVHHPYESFAPVVEFVEQAAADPSVLAIKMTLYRTSSDSPIIKALIKAAENGKQVAALMELKARFDEERNILLAKQMERAGVHVVYGLVGLKTHAKICLVVRKEQGGIRRYVHLGTGNYNPNTARLYTDLSLFTCDPDLCDDASELFNLLTGYSRMPEWKKLAVAPITMRSRIQSLIEEQTALARAGKPARIRAKMNSLVDQHIICKLYEASGAGVRIDLVVRGTCCLKAGVKGLSENIRVSSIVDRFLEHSRIYIFGEGEDEKVYLASADWMPRNLDRRVEAFFPIENPEAKRRVITEIFETTLRDNTKRRELLPDGTYRRVARRPGEKPLRSQLVFLDLETHVRLVPSPETPRPTTVFVCNEEGSTEEPIPLQPIRPAARRVRIPASSPVREFHNNPRPIELVERGSDDLLAKPTPAALNQTPLPRRPAPKQRKK
ncbi:polyphosphate kinase 1 [bacterium]|nr:polyphosphate kinase 1 [bacterium]